MSKKILKGFIKSRHFTERQKERDVSDSDVIKAITRGEFVQGHDGQSYVFGNLKITVDHAQEILITVFSDVKKPSSSKIISKEDSKKILEMIAERKKEEIIEEVDEFQKYLSENPVKKINK